jgi:thiamine-phosphate pyrophosphorylase
MPLDLNVRPVLMAITQDRPELSHLDQVRGLLLAGVSWIQLRMKSGGSEEKLSIARAASGMCAIENALLIINDSVDLALASGANGVHLGSEDEAWVSARQRAGRTLLIGGTVNNAADAERAVSCGCLDYVGIGPWRFTHTKAKLAPVLGPEGIEPLLRRISPLPAWIIGGVLPQDMPAIRGLGAAGAAVSGGLIQGNSQAAAAEYLRAWGKL